MILPFTVPDWLSGAVVGAVIGAVATYQATMRAEFLRQRYERRRDAESERKKAAAAATQLLAAIARAQQELTNAQAANRWPQLKGAAPFKPRHARQVIARNDSVFKAVESAEAKLKNLARSTRVAVGTAKAAGEGTPTYSQETDQEITAAIDSLTAAHDALEPIAQTGG